MSTELLEQLELAQQNTGERETILIVDDSAAIRQMVSFTLRSAGYTIIEAEDGEEALIKVKGQVISLVLTDQNMPNMDGLSLVKALRNLPKFASTPILMLTTESGDAKKMEGKAAGANGWLVKPFNPNTLINVVRKFIG